MTRFPLRRTFLAVIIAVGAAQVFAQSVAEHPQFPPPAHEKQAPAVEKNLKKFDTLDFDVFSNQKWNRLAESHAKDIVVTWPDGHETKGIDKHIEDLKAMFVYAPDINIKVHPIRMVVLGYSRLYETAWPGQIASTSPNFALHRTWSRPLLRPECGSDPLAGYTSCSQPTNTVSNNYDSSPTSFTRSRLGRLRW